MAADGHLIFDTKIDESGFNSGIGKLMGLAAKGFTAITAAGIAAFGAVTGASLKSVASLEQNIGGVETLFKESADTVIENANRAYETAGMSANEYMSTVTSFSASLLQSLGGDTAKAAEVADMAIRDMSDNANKMGTSMELIQNAYQGFAKQNYTMLDNLKLGYGGTKTEMERLLKDAEKISGIKYDISNLNDVYQAIHVVQTELGITGTTAKEAATTIEGSVNAAKAAWDNFLNGSGTAEEFADAFSTAAVNIIENLGEIVPRLVSTIPTAVKAIYDQLAVQFEANAPVFAKQAGNIIENLVTGIEQNAPKLLTSAAELIGSLGTGLGERLPELIPVALQMIVTLADAIISNLPTIVSAGISIIKGLGQGIVNSIPTIITEAPRIINEFANAIYSGLGQLIQVGWEIIKSLGQGIWDNKGLLLENAGQILLAIINVFSLSKMVSLGKNLISSMIKGIKGMASAAKNAGSNILTNIVNGIKALATHPISTLKNIATDAINAVRGLDWKGIGKNIISGIVSGIKATAGKLVEAAANAVTDALNWVKKKLDINSPSGVFRDQVGKMMALGIGVGFEKNLPIESMNNGLQKAVNDIKKDVILTTSARQGRTVGGIKKNPMFYPENPGADWDEWERRQRKLNKERDSRPIYLGTDRIDKKLPKGAVPVW